MNVNHVRKIFRITLAVVLLFVGVLGLVLPILNGIIPITIGLILLSFESKYVQSALENAVKKNHRVEHWYHRLAKIIRRFFKIKP